MFQMVHSTTVTGQTFSVRYVERFSLFGLLWEFAPVLERLLLNRLCPIIEHVLIPEQAGFRPANPPRQIVHCPGVETRPAQGRWLWNRGNHRHSLRRSLACVWHIQPPESAWEGLQHDKGLPPDGLDSHSTGEPSILRRTRREKK